MDLVIEKIQGTPYSRIKRVPLVSTGIEYNLGSGPKTFSEEDLADALLAVRDPGVPGMRLKIGHHDKRFDGAEFDGEPCLGRIENQVIGNNGQTLYGDYVTFDWLANLIPIAYPSRSIEAGVGVEVGIVENFRTVTHNKYRMAIKYVSLLGITWPGCTTLEDLPLLASPGGPPGLEVHAAMNIEDVRRAYYATLGDDSESRFWWIRGMQLAPNRLIVDHDDGTLYRVPFSVEDDKVEFGEPVRVNLDYPDVPAPMAASIAASAMLSEPGAIIYASRAESRPTTTGGRMDRAELCASLGLPSDATDLQITEATRAVMLASGDPTPPAADPPATPAADPPADPPASDPPAQPTDPPADPPAAPATPPADPNPAPPADPEGNPELQAALVDPNALLAMQAEVAELRKMREAQLLASDAQFVEQSVKEGRIPPSSRESYLSQMSRDREGTRTFLASLKPGVVPVAQMGTTGAAAELEAAGGNASLPTDWFPEITRRKERQQSAVQADGNYARGGLNVG